MPELFRTRDVVVYTKGRTGTFRANNSLLASGWAGGQGLIYVPSTTDEMMVGPSTGVPSAGFVLWGSSEDGDQLVASTGYQVAHGYLVACWGSWVISTRTYERHTYASRQSGPLVSLTYTEGARLFFSLRGLLTTEDEWTLSADPRAPNSFVVGSVSKTFNDGYLGAYLSL